MNNVEIYLFISVAFLMLNVAKQYMFGVNFEIHKWLIHGEDYKKWYNFKQQYIPPNKRKHFKSKK